MTVSSYKGSRCYNHKHMCVGDTGTRTYTLTHVLSLQYQALCQDLGLHASLSGTILWWPNPILKLPSCCWLQVGRAGGYHLKIWDAEPSFGASIMALQDSCCLSLSDSMWALVQAQQLHFQPSSLPTCWEGSRRWSMYLCLYYPLGRPWKSSYILAVAWPSLAACGCLGSEPME